MSVTKRLKLLCVFIAGFFLIWIPGVALAVVDNSAYWPFEVTEKWNAIYGTISGISHLQAGDSIGVFDAAGDCYGAGVFNGTYYFLSAFEEDRGDKTDDDYPIPGFRVGDGVVFKIYSEAAGRVYAVETSGAPYVYTSRGKYPPLRIDLVYEEEDGDDDGGNGGSGNGGGNGGGDGGGDGDSTPDTTSGGGGVSLPTIAEAASESTETQDLSSGADDTTPEAKEDSGVTYYGPEDEGYLSTDYPERTYPARGTSKKAVRGRGSKKKALAVAKAPSSYSKSPAIKKKPKEAKQPKAEIPAKKGVPLAAKVFFVISIPASLLVAAKKFLII